MPKPFTVSSRLECERVLYIRAATGSTAHLLVVPPFFSQAFPGLSLTEKTFQQYYLT